MADAIVIKGLKEITPKALEKYIDTQVAKMSNGIKGAAVNFAAYMAPKPEDRMQFVLALIHSQLPPNTRSGDKAREDILNNIDRQISKQLGKIHKWSADKELSADKIFKVTVGKKEIKMKIAAAERLILDIKDAIAPKIIHQGPNPIYFHENKAKFASLKGITGGDNASHTDDLQANAPLISKARTGKKPDDSLSV